LAAAFSASTSAFALSCSPVFGFLGDLDSSRADFDGAKGLKPQSLTRQRCSTPEGSLWVISCFETATEPPDPPFASYSSLPASSMGQAFFATRKTPGDSILPEHAS
jgi:hypothetical protein